MIDMTTLEVLEQGVTAMAIELARKEGLTVRIIRDVDLFRVAIVG